VGRQWEILAFAQFYYLNFAVFWLYEPTLPTPRLGAKPYEAGM
jgi:hypothetical protein